MKKGPTQSISPRESISKLIEEFNRICDKDVAFEEWDFSTLFAEPYNVKTLSKKEIYAFVDDFKDFNNGKMIGVPIEEAIINYPKLQENIDKQIGTLNAKSEENTLSDQQIVDLCFDNEAIHAGESRILCLHSFLDVLVRQFEKLYPAEKQDVIAQILSVMFLHLPNCLIYRGKQYLSVGDISEHETLELNIGMLTKYLEPYISSEDRDVFLKRTADILHALEISYRYGLLLDDSENAQKCKDLFESVLKKATDALPDAKKQHSKSRKKQQKKAPGEKQALSLEELENQIEQITKKLKLTHDTFVSNPWMPLFRAYTEDFEPTMPLENLDVDNALNSLLAQIDTPDFNAQFFVEQLVLITTYFENPPTEITFETIENYANFLKTLSQKFKTNNITKEFNLDLTISALLLDIEDLYTNDKISEILQECATLLNEDIQSNLILSEEDYIKSCEQLLHEYQIYANKPKNEIEHLALARKLKGVIHEFKITPQQAITQERVKAFQNAVIKIMMLFKSNNLYLNIAKSVNQAITPIRAALASEAAKATPQVEEPEDSEEDTEIDTALLLDEPVQDESDSDSAFDIDKTPVISSDDTPVVSPPPSESPSLVVEQDCTTSSSQNDVDNELQDQDLSVQALALQIEDLNIQENNADSEVDALELEFAELMSLHSQESPKEVSCASEEPSLHSQEKSEDQNTPSLLSKAQVDEALSERSAQLAQSRAQVETSLAEKNLDEIKKLKAELEQRESALIQANEKRLKALEDKYSRELEAQRAALLAEHQKKMKQSSDSFALAAQKLEKRFTADLAALPAQVKAETSQKKKDMYDKNQVALAKLQADFKQKFECERTSHDDSIEIAELQKQFQANLQASIDAFEAQKEQIRQDLIRQKQAAFEHELQQQHMRQQEELANYRQSLEIDLHNAHRISQIRLRGSFEQAKLALNTSTQAQRSAVVNNVDLPLVLVQYLGGFEGTPLAPLGIDKYNHLINCLFNSPFYQTNLNVIYNSGLLKSILPTLPDHFEHILNVKHPHLYQFISVQLHEANSTNVQHISQLLAPLLLIPIMIKQQEQVDDIESYIDDCIAKFVDCFDLKQADKVALAKALGSHLIDKQVALDDNKTMMVPGLYSKYCKYVQNLIARKEQLELAKSAPRGYHPQYQRGPSTSHRDLQVPVTKRPTPF
ncbi:MAG: hypothetical protein AB7V32_01875 [Candidatus Berkiella sp.]